MKSQRWIVVASFLVLTVGLLVQVSPGWVPAATTPRADMVQIEPGWPVLTLRR